MVLRAETRRPSLRLRIVGRFGMRAMVAASATACGLILGLDDPQTINSSSGPATDAAAVPSEGSVDMDGDVTADGGGDGRSGDGGDAGAFDGSYDAAAQHFEGGTGTVWEPRGVTFSPSSGTFADYWPKGARAFYGLTDNAGDDMFRYDSVNDDWGFLGAFGSPPTRGTSPTMALVEHGLYLVRSGAVYRVGDGTNNDAGPWVTRLTNLPVTTSGITTHDDNDIVLALTEGALPKVIRYDPANNTFTTVATSLPGASSAPRLGWDSVTSRLFVAPTVGPELYEVDTMTGATTARMSCPEAFASRTFCSDRSGHIYAAGDAASPRTFWQYDVLNNTWKKTPDLAFDKGLTGSCIVSQDGWLYVSNGMTALGNFARLALLP